MPVFGLAGRTEIGASFFCFIEYKKMCIRDSTYARKNRRIQTNKHSGVHRNLSITTRSRHAGREEFLHR